MDRVLPDKFESAREAIQYMGYHQDFRLELVTDGYRRIIDCELPDWTSDALEGFAAKLKAKGFDNIMMLFDVIKLKECFVNLDAVRRISGIGNEWVRLSAITPELFLAVALIEL